MLIFWNKSPSWYSDEPFQYTEFAGVLTHVRAEAPPDIENPDISSITLRYDVVIIDAEEWDPANYRNLIGKKVQWDNHTWRIEDVAKHGGEEGSYQIAIRRPKRSQPRRLPCKD